MLRKRETESRRHSWQPCEKRETCKGHPQVQRTICPHVALAIGNNGCQVACRRSTCKARSVPVVIPGGVCHVPFQMQYKRYLPSRLLPCSTAFHVTGPPGRTSSLLSRLRSGPLVVPCLAGADGGVRGGGHGGNTQVPIAKPCMEEEC